MNKRIIIYISFLLFCVIVIKWVNLHEFEFKFFFVQSLSILAALFYLALSITLFFTFKNTLKKFDIEYYFWAFSASIGIIIYLWLSNFMNNHSNDALGGISVEFHGMVFDIIILGFGFAIYNSYKEKENRIDRYREEIDDYRFWRDDEARYRILGLIKRLNKEGVYDIDLSYIHMDEWPSSLIFRNSDFSHGVFPESSFFKFEGCKFNNAQLPSTRFGSNMSKCTFDYANLQKSIFHEVNISDCSFFASNLENAVIEYGDAKNSDFRHANLENATIRYIDSNNIDMSGAKLLNTRIFKTDLSNVKLQYTQAYSYQKEVYKSLGANVNEMNFLSSENIPQEVINAFLQYHKKEF